MESETKENDRNYTCETHDIDLVPKDSGWTWMCCLGCFLQAAISSGGVVKSFGIMYVAFMEEFNSKAGAAAWIIGLCIALQHFAGSGCAMSFFVSIAHMGQYFKKKRAIANGIALSGVGTGTLVLPPIFRLLLDTYGLNGALLVMAGISLNVCVSGALLRPISAFNTMKGNRFEKISSLQSDKRPTIYTLIEWSLLKKYSFLSYGVSMLIFAAGFPAYFVTVPAFAEQVGLPKLQAAYLLSLAGIADIIGRISIGLLADFHFIPTHLLMTILILLGAIFALLTVFMTDFVSLGFFNFAFTITAGPIVALNPVLLAEDLGAHRLHSALGITSLFIGAGSLLGFPVAGALRDATGDWKPSFYFSSAAMLLCALTLVFRSFVCKSE